MVWQEGGANDTCSSAEHLTPECGLLCLIPKGTLTVSTETGVISMAKLEN